MDALGAQTGSWRASRQGVGARAHRTTVALGQNTMPRPSRTNTINSTSSFSYTLTLLFSLPAAMARNYRYFCQSCLSTHPNDKRVSRAAATRHRKGKQGPSGIRKQWTCTCVEHPNGHLFNSKATYYRHFTRAKFYTMIHTVTLFH